MAQMPQMMPIAAAGTTISTCVVSCGGRGSHNAFMVGRAAVMWGGVKQVHWMPPLSAPVWYGNNAQCVTEHPNLATHLGFDLEEDAVKHAELALPAVVGDSTHGWADSWSRCPG